jgi:hypothetical protein
MTPSIVAPLAARGSRTISIGIALMPVWLLLITALSSAAFSAVLSDPPMVMAMPLGVVVESIAVLWALVGVGLVWRAASPFAEAIALLLFTIPSTVVVVATPAVIELLPTVS